jgi:hypothetical protein
MSNFGGIGIMDDNKKGFWKYFAFLVAGAVLNFCGGLIGKTTIGFILYGLGLAAVIAVAILVFLKKDYFRNGQLKILIFAAILGLLFAAGTALLVSGSASAASPAGFSGQMPSGSMPSGNFPSGGQMQGGGQMPSGGNFSGNNSSSTGTSNRGSWSSNSAGGNLPGGNLSSHSSSLKNATRVIGWIALGVGAAFLVFLVILLLTKKLDLKGDHWKVALLGFVVFALIASAAALMFAKPAAASFPTGMQAPGGQQGTLLQNAASTEAAAATDQATETATETATPEPSATNAPEPTATATVETYDKLVVCLNYDIQVGINIRDFPAETGRNVGTIPMAGCFTIDGKNSQNEGWYHLASGQNGIGGITISDRFADSDNLWVKGDNFLISKDKLDLLKEVPVAADATATPTGK